MITVKYLASLADELGKTSDTIEFVSEYKVIDIWNKLNPDIAIKSNTICSIDFEYANLGDLLLDNIELAFFPPVTGG